MPTFELSPPVFTILSSLIEERSGLHYEPKDRALLADKLSVRAAETGFDSLLDYYYFLRYDRAGEQEMSELTESLVVGETYFFREWPAIQVLVEDFLTPWSRKKRRLRVWSAACATGEEPLSLAMLLEERGLLDRVELVATDISGKALAKAQRGHYGKRAVRGAPPRELVNRYLEEMEDGYTVSPSLIAAIRWEKRNLLSLADARELGPFDAILCRNVLIYFSDPTIHSVLGSLLEALIPSGVLLIGVSESLLRYGSGFTGEERGGAFVYRKGGSRCALP